MTSKLSGGLRGFARTGQDGARQSMKYYSGSGSDERRLIKVALYMGVSSAVLWYILAAYWGALDFKSIEIGYMFAAGSAASATTLVMSGFLADKFGRKKLLIVGLAGSALGTALFISEKNFLVFMAANVIVSLSNSIVGPSLMALLSTKAEPSKLKFLYGMQSFSNTIGLTLGTLVGLMAPDLLWDFIGADTITGYKYVYLTAAAIAVIPVVYSLRVRETHVPSERLLLEFDRRTVKMLAMYSLQNVFIGLGAAMVMPWIAIIFSEGMGASGTQLSLMFTLSNIMLAAGFFVIPVFERARGAVTLVAVCQLASVPLLVLIPYSPTLLVAAVLYAVRSLLMLVPSPILNAYIMNVVNEKIRASFLAISTLAWTLAFMVSEASSGYLWNGDYTKTEPFLYCGLFYVLGTLTFFLYFRKIKEPASGAPRAVGKK